MFGDEKKELTHIDGVVQPEGKDIQDDVHVSGKGPLKVIGVQHGSGKNKEDKDGYCEQVARTEGEKSAEQK